MRDVLGSRPVRQIWAKPAALRRMRQLDFDGQVLVGEGATVRPADVVARGIRVPVPVAVPLSQLLRLQDVPIERYLRAPPGSAVRQGDVLARAGGLLGLGARVCLSPASGTLALGPPGSGAVLIAPPDEEVEVRAHYPGSVVSIVPRRGVVVEVTGVGVQGVAGCPGETDGPILVLAGPRDQIAARSLTQQECGAVVVGGSIDLAGLRRAVEAGVHAVVVGSIRAADFAAFLLESRQLPLVVVEGFGSQGMAERCHDLLRQYERQIGRIRVGRGEPGEPPEIVVALDAPGVPRERPLALEVGGLVRVVAGPRAFSLGQVESIRPVLEPTATGLPARWLDLRLDGGERARVPLASVELVSA